MADVIEFVNGLIVKAPHERAPDFVKASISIKVQDLQSWLATRSEDWVNIDVKESKGGKWYAAVSTFKPKQEERKPQRQESSDSFDSDIPF